VEDVSKEDDRQPGLDPSVRVPVLSIHAKKDVVVVPGTDQMMKMFILDLETVEVDSGHWVQLEKRDEFDEILKYWVDEVEKKG
jgi:pimeloyl-ACP methyl ester carboxylesterase